jgi:hypothetical protein
VSRRRLWILVGVLVIVLIAAVILFLMLSRPPSGSPSAAPTPTPSATASETPTPTPTPTSLAADALVVITATATDASGARLALTMVVHKPVSTSDPAGAAALAQLSGECGADSNWAVQNEPESGIGRIDVKAVPLGTVAWPSGSEVSFWPTNNNLKVTSGTGVAPSVHYQNDPPLPPCENQRALYGAANGTVSVLMWARPAFGDPVDDPNIYRWIQQDYGFFGASGPDGPVTIGDCTVRVTDAARTYGWNESLWREAIDSYDCVGSGVFV